MTPSDLRSPTVFPLSLLFPPPPRPPLLPVSSSVALLRSFLLTVLFPPPLSSAAIPTPPLVSLCLWIDGNMSHACSFSSAKFLKFGGARTATPLKHFRLASKSFSRQMAMHSIHHDGSRGALIVLEGLDRSGKTSQCSRLVSHLEGKGISVEAWRFPDRKTDIGIMISSYLANKSQLDDQAVHLLFSANRWEKRLSMETKLRSGTTIVVDRYSYSGVAFSAAKGLDVEWCKAPETGLIAPDLVIYLDLPPEEATKRGAYGTERYEQLEFQRNVARQYQKLRDSTWKVVDAQLPVEDLEIQLRKIALECIATCQKKTITTLWPSK